jgi:hypothetical protein
MSKEQLAAAQSLNDVLAAAAHAQRAGDSAGAIRHYEKARDMFQQSIRGSAAESCRQAEKQLEPINR